MLETKPQSIGRTTVRATAPRSFTSASYTGRTAAARAIPAPLPERDARAAERAARQAVNGRSREQRMARSEARLLAWTVAAAVVVCGLLVVYVAAYARVSALGIDQSKMRAAYRAKWQENQLLRAREADLKSPYRIADRAERLGLTKSKVRVDYIAPSAAVPDAPAPIMLGAVPRADTFSDNDVTATNANDAATRVGDEAGSQGTDSGRQKTIPPQLATIRSRSGAVLALVALFYLLLAGRLIYLQAFRHQYFLKQADLYRVVSRTLPAQRGLLLDRNGESLAINVPASTIYADPREVKDIPATAARLAPLVGIDEAKLRDLLIPKSPKDHYRLLAHRLSVDTGNAVRKADLRGIGVAQDTKRSYPDSGLAAQVLGFTNRDGDGIEGIESSQEALLHGKDGKVVGEIDRQGRLLPGTQRRQVEPVNGHDLVLTIDKQLQHAADVRLAQALKDNHAEKGVVVIMDPQTGEILALSNAPGFNPNMPRPAKKLDRDDALKVVARYRNTAVSDLYEPGSTLKTLTAAAVLQEQGLKMMDVYVPCTGHLQVGNHVIHEAPDALTAHLGNQNLRGILRVSSNVGMAQFGLGLGQNRMYEYEQKFGLIDKPGTGLPGEPNTLLSSPEAYNKFTGRVGWSNIQTANIAFGQGISVTPVQLAAAYSAIANGGTLLRPHILRAVRTGGVDTAVKPEPIRRVLDPAVAAAVRSMLGTVVQDGTGKPAQIGGFSVGGKTGSAQVSGAHGYLSGQFVASFVGMVPLSHPRLVILCAVFQPQGLHWGATVAAPVVHDIAKQAMLQMHITPDDPAVIDWDDHLKYKAKAKRHVAQLNI